MSLKIYIAGKVTGLPERKTANKFLNAEILLALEDFQGISPLKVVNNPKADWKEAMKLCIVALIECDAVLLLPDWMRSKGAKLEVEICDQLGIPTFNNIKDLKTWNNSRPTERKEKKLD